jgi:hypothetical protein
MQGRQQQTAIPITQAKATQKTAKKTSNARKTMVSLQREENRAILDSKQAECFCYAQCHTSIKEAETYQ